MLKFRTYKATNVSLNHYAENKDFELEFIISRKLNGGWQLSEYQYGVFNGYKNFDKLSDAKAWAKLQDSYLVECYPDPEDLKYLHKEPSWCQF